MGIVQEFKAFAMRGNVVDMAVGIIMGAAFGRIVSSFVSDVLMPPIGKLLGNMDFSDLFVNLSPGKGPFESLAQAKAAGAATLNYGLFLSTVLDFVLIALAIFALVKAMNVARRKEAVPPAPPEAPPQEKLLAEIRDLLKAGR